MLAACDLYIRSKKPGTHPSFPGPIFIEEVHVQAIVSGGRGPIAEGGRRGARPNSVGGPPSPGAAGPRPNARGGDGGTLPVGAHDTWGGGDSE